MNVYAICHVAGNKNDETMTFVILKLDQVTDSSCQVIFEKQGIDTFFSEKLNQHSHRQGLTRRQAEITGRLKKYFTQILVVIALFGIRGE